MESGGRINSSEFDATRERSANWARIIHTSGTDYIKSIFSLIKGDAGIGIDDLDSQEVVS